MDLVLDKVSNGRHVVIEEWLKSVALPIWSDVGYDSDQGGFCEEIDFGGDAMVASPRRVRVQFRQMYVYSHAFMLGYANNGIEVARNGFDYVTKNAWSPDFRQGWVHKLNADGSVLDGKRDLYDCAFALLGLSWYQRASMNAKAGAYIEKTLDYIDTALASPHGGWLENDCGEGHRRQNPHMHLFEASMALYDATGDRRHLERAGHIFDLFEKHFFDADRGVLLEFFEDDWTPVADPAVQQIEPGHMMEWVWLLRQYAERVDVDVDHYADTLYDNALRLGMDPSRRFMVDVLNGDGELVSGSRRLWPQTEFLKAALVQYRRHGDSGYLRQALNLIDAIFEDYLDKCPAGTWRDQMDLEGTCIADRIPASSFYHLFCAFAEAAEVLRGDNKVGDPMGVGSRRAVGAN